MAEEDLLIELNRIQLNLTPYAESSAAKTPSTQTVSMMVCKEALHLHFSSPSSPLQIYRVYTSISLTPVRLCTRPTELVNLRPLQINYGSPARTQSLSDCWPMTPFYHWPTYDDTPPSPSQQLAYKNFGC